MYASSWKISREGESLGDLGVERYNIKITHETRFGRALVKAVVKLRVL
jgi:hypothetical protein